MTILAKNWRSFYRLNLTAGNAEDAEEKTDDAEETTGFALTG
jgi:hypothetical protein